LIYLTTEQVQLHRRFAEDISCRTIEFLDLATTALAPGALQARSDAGIIVASTGSRSLLDIERYRHAYGLSQISSVSPPEAFEKGVYSRRIIFYGRPLQRRVILPCIASFSTCMPWSYAGGHGVSDAT
jgi:hypothetical protein